MMFRSIFLKTLRDQRWPVIIWSAITVLVTVAGYEAFKQVNPAQVESLINNSAFVFFNDPVEVGTAAGFVTFRYGFFFSLVLCIFVVLIGGRLLRGEEARGSIELLLARPRSRGRLFAEKVLASVFSILILGQAFSLGAVLGENRLNLSVSIGNAMLTGFNLSALLFFYAMLALLISQYTQTSGSAAGIAGGLYALAFIIDGTGRVYESAAWVRRLSPNYYSDLSKPLITSYGTNYLALAFLLFLGLLLLTASAIVFLRRDVGSVAALPFIDGRLRADHIPRPEAVIDRSAQDRWLTSVFMRSLRATGPALGWWSLGVFIYAAYGSGIAKSSEDQFRNLVEGSTLASKLFKDALQAANNGFLALIVFTFAAIIVLLYALMRAGDWPSDQDNGRLDMVLSTPHPRWQVALQSYLAAIIGFVLLALATTAGVLAAALVTHLAIDAGRVLAASLAFVPPMAVVASAVYALGARLRSGVVMGIVGAYLGLAFFMDLLRSFLNLPSWILHLSVFNAYGQPMLNGIDWTASITMLALAVLFAAAGIYLFQTGDLRQGG